MKSAHTPTPWQFDKIENGQRTISATDGSWYQFASVFIKNNGQRDPIGEANAALIVKAVNEREGIFAAMKGFDTWFRTFIGEETYNEINCPEMDAFRDALAKAEAE